MNFEIHGLTDPGAKTVLLSSGLGGAASFWQPQLGVLEKHYRVVLYDHRGTGKNTEPLPDDYSISNMADDVIEILDQIGLEQCTFIGHALGGIVGLDLALRDRVRVDRLVLINAWARPNSQTARCFAMRKELLNNVGVEAYVKAQPIFLFPAVWLAQNEERLARETAHGIAHFQGKETVLKRIEALLKFDVKDKLSQISIPTFVAAARDDILVPWTASQELAEALQCSELWIMPEGGHGFTVMKPALFNEALLNFLTSVTLDPFKTNAA